MNDGLGILGLYRRILSFCIEKYILFIGLKVMHNSNNRSQSAALAAENSCLAWPERINMPMEGFDSVVKRILGLPRRAEINMVIGCGKGQKEGFGDLVADCNDISTLASKYPRIRRPFI